MAISDTIGDLTSEAKKLPVWFWVVGAGGVAYLVWRNSQSNNNTASAPALGTLGSTGTEVGTSGGSVGTVGSPGSTNSAAQDYYNQVAAANPGATPSQIQQIISQQQAYYNQVAAANPGASPAQIQQIMQQQEAYRASQQGGGGAIPATEVAATQYEFSRAFGH